MCILVISVDILYRYYFVFEFIAWVMVIMLVHSMSEVNSCTRVASATCRTWVNDFQIHAWEFPWSCISSLFSLKLTGCCVFDSKLTQRKCIERRKTVKRAGEQSRSTERGQSQSLLHYVKQAVSQGSRKQQPGADGARGYSIPCFPKCGRVHSASGEETATAWITLQPGAKMYQ